MSAQLYDWAIDPTNGMVADVPYPFSCHFDQFDRPTGSHVHTISASAGSHHGAHDCFCGPHGGPYPHDDYVEGCPIPGHVPGRFAR